MIKYDHERGDWVCSYSSRHPVTRIPKTLRRVGLKSRAEAKRTYNKLVILVEDSFKHSVTPTWSEAVDDFIKSLYTRGLTIKTIENYEKCIKAHTFKNWKDRLVDEITTEEIRNLINIDLQDKSDGQRKHIYRYIRSIYIYLIEKRVINYNPVPRMTFKFKNKMKIVLNEDQVRLFLKRAREMNSEWYPVWLVALYTGCRSGELYALKWDKIDLINNKILINESWNSKDGFKSTKSGDERFIEIAPKLKEFFIAHKKRNDSDIFVLPRISSWSAGRQVEPLRAFLEGMGLPSIRFHDLRASWATMLLNKGVETIKVMFMGGWKDLKTMRIYISSSGINLSGVVNDLCLES